jgi:hypothetical protein
MTLSSGEPFRSRDNRPVRCSRSQPSLQQTPHYVSGRSGTIQSSLLCLHSSTLLACSTLLILYCGSSSMRFDGFQKPQSKLMWADEKVRAISSIIKRWQGRAESCRRYQDREGKLMETISQHRCQPVSLVPVGTFGARGNLLFGYHRYFQRHREIGGHTDRHFIVTGDFNRLFQVNLAAVNRKSLCL